MPECTPNAPDPLSFPRLSSHDLLESKEPDYLRLILSAKVYDILKETPLVYALNLSAKLGNQIWLKREDLQEVFSFKIRGAYNFMAHMPQEERWMGVITCSAGQCAYPCSGAHPCAHGHFTFLQETTLKESHYQAQNLTFRAPS